MKKDSSATLFVGLDVHKASISLSVAREGERSPAQTLGAIGHDMPVLLSRLKRLGSQERILCAYEAGPTGFGLKRFLEAQGIRCVVIAPSKTPVRSGDRIKTDRRDASKLASFLRSGELTVIHVPTPETEAMRDLVRAREDARRARQNARHQLSKFLLRQARCYPGKTSWTLAHMSWIRSQSFEHAAQQEVLLDHVHEVERLGDRLEALESHIARLSSSSSQAPLMRALQSLRGVSLITSATIAFEIGDLRRFAKASQFMGYLGLVPREYSSGERTRRGSLTKAGNTHVRRVLVEAAWNYRTSPRRSRAIMARSRGVAAGVQDIAWKAQCRLHARYRRMLSRGKNRQRTVTAVARELAGFVWAIGQEEQLISA